MSAVALSTKAIELAREKLSRSPGSIRAPSNGARQNGVPRIQYEAEMGRVDDALREMKAEIADTRKDVVDELKGQAERLRHIELSMARLEGRREIEEDKR